VEQKKGNPAAARALQQSLQATQACDTTLILEEGVSRSDAIARPAAAFAVIPGFGSYPDEKMEKRSSY